MLLEYKGKTPKIGKNVYIAPTAVIVGDVTIGDGASIWFGAVLRGDCDAIVVGDNTNLQDNVIVHADHGKPAIIGNNVTIGHNAVIHGCTLEDNCLVGISAVVLNSATIGKGAMVAAGAVIRDGQVVEPWTLMAGTPAVEKKKLPELPDGEIARAAQEYMELSSEYRELMDN